MLEGLDSSFEELELGVEVTAKEVPELRRKLREVAEDVKKIAYLTKKKRHSILKEKFNQERESLDTADREGTQLLLEKYNQLWKEEESRIDKQADREVMVRSAPCYKALDVINTSLLRKDRKSLQKQLQQRNRNLKQVKSQAQAMESELKMIHAKFEKFKSEASVKYNKLKREASKKITELNSELIRTKAQLEVYKSQASVVTPRHAVTTDTISSLKRNLCPFFVKGKCKFGANCHHVHDTRFHASQQEDFGESKMDAQMARMGLQETTENDDDYIW
eukprot:CAMPEP_0185262894 /NCGR_PEP_ID=MMETSP1359-20130426/10919_1 /TAXON_ID=552665 /ORGANISM="Bigelowiella longifila, Strain CCMP242" /LENGTH=276 /DNA_ID=CAMNT_0027849961 /DNA_START=119 /DNA_END=946 /DNA_ORIENTATION=-